MTLRPSTAGPATAGSVDAGDGPEARVDAAVVGAEVAETGLVWVTDRSVAGESWLEPSENPSSDGWALPWLRCQQARTCAASA